MLFRWLLILVAVIVLLLAVLVYQEQNRGKKARARLAKADHIPAAVLVMTSQKEKDLWPMFLQGLQLIRSLFPQWPIYFVSDVPPPTVDFPIEYRNQGNTATYGRQLIEVLRTIPEDFILYLEPWYMLTLPPFILADTVLEMQAQGWKHYKLNPQCTFKYPMMYDPTNPLWYVISHQPAWWTREFLFSTVTDVMTQNKHELQANQFLHLHPELCENIICGSLSLPYRDLRLAEEKAAILIHTFDAYRRYWEGWLHFFQKYHPEPQWHIYFAVEDLDVSQVVKNFPTSSPYYHQIHCGKGEWGQRLLTALKQIPEKYVLYLQEDFWLTSPLKIEFLNDALDIVKTQNLLSLKLQQSCEHDIGLPTDYNNPRWYIGTHQPSLWNKEFLQSTIKPSMTCFIHETTLNKNLHQNHAAAKRFHQIAQYRQDIYFPYLDVSRQGKLRAEGLHMLEAEGLQYRIGEDEVLFRPCK